MFLNWLKLKADLSSKQEKLAVFKFFIYKFSNLFLKDYRT